MLNGISLLTINEKTRFVRALVEERSGRDWCLFLDRDGVINRKIDGDYVRNLTQFEWSPNAVSALKKLENWAPRIVVVTNQQGVGKGLMSAIEVDEIHMHIKNCLAMEGVNIDSIKVCPHLQSANCDCRKPSPSLVLSWLQEHPNAAASLSIVIGDSECDLKMSQNIAKVSGRCEYIQIGFAENLGPSVLFFESLFEFADLVDTVKSLGTE